MADVKGYNEVGMSKVLTTAAELTKRASFLLGECDSILMPSVSKVSYRKEAALCLAEAEELIAAVRKEGSL